MQPTPTRRALLGAVLGSGAGAAALSPAAGYLESFAPLSGDLWREQTREVPDTVASSHGEASVTYDDHQVPHVEADGEPAAYFAVGYVHAADRLFEMDLVRRLMAGRLAEVVGERAVESDVFHVEMDFRGAAQASAQRLRGTETEGLGRAYADGVNAYIEEGPLPLEFGLLGYEPEPWTALDTLLVGTRITWGLTGSFRALRRDVLRRKLGADRYERLHGRRFDHGAPIIREGTAGQVEGADVGRGVAGRLRDANAGLADALGRFEPPRYAGSNHWAVAGEHTASGSPILAYDPHLSLMAPPVWYEQHVSAGDVDVRGATFPGVPFVIVGENDHGAWGFTNTGADVMDLYTYETDGDQYRYRDGWRDFVTDTRTVAVDGGEDREVRVRKTVHGAFLKREVDGESRHVGVAWTGMGGTREWEAVAAFSRTRGVDDYREALRSMDVPTQNALYVDDAGNVLYKVTGRIPIRRVGGQVVRGDRVFDGSAAEGEWRGFEPFGESDWSGFVPFEDKPGLLNPDYVGTANQRPVDDPDYPIGQEYASGFRGMRIYERLDERIADGDEPVDRAFMVDVQRDVLDIRARMLVPAILAARDRMPSYAEPWLDELAEWDLRMERGSAAALLFDRFYEAFREATWGEAYEAMGLDDDWWPAEWVLVTLPADHAFFGGDRAAVLAQAVGEAVAEIDREGWDTYGDVNRPAIDHPFGSQVSALNYPRYATDGTGYTLFNVRRDSGHGSSWRQVSPMAGESLSVIPGGQDGSYFSPHYHDQLRMWADGRYKPMVRTIPDADPDVEFGGDVG